MQSLQAHMTWHISLEEKGEARSNPWQRPEIAQQQRRKALSCLFTIVAREPQLHWVPWGCALWLSASINQHQLYDINRVISVQGHNQVLWYFPLWFLNCTETDECTCVHTDMHHSSVFGHSEDQRDIPPSEDEIETRSLQLLQKIVLYVVIFIENVKYKFYQQWS